MGNIRYSICNQALVLRAYMALVLYLIANRAADRNVWHPPPSNYSNLNPGRSEIELDSLLLHPHLSDPLMSSSLSFLPINFLTPRVPRRTPQTTPDIFSRTHCDPTHRPPGTLTGLASEPSIQICPKICDLAAVVGRPPEPYPSGWQG